MHYHINDDSYLASKQGNIAFNQQKDHLLEVGTIVSYVNRSKSPINKKFLEQIWRNQVKRIFSQKT